MEFLQLKYFLDVSETEHMTRSAERLNIAQPALTQAIRRLERELGVELFCRRGRNIRLTPCGKHLRDRLIPMAAEFQKIPDELRALSNLEGATIHINVTAASSLVAEAIELYLRENENVHFTMTQMATDEISDISISMRPHTARGEMGVFICPEEIYLAVPAAGRFGMCARVDLAEMETEGFISLMGSRALRRLCDDCCRTAGFLPHIVFESDNPGAVRSMIAANMGVGFWPAFTWGKIDTDRVRLLEVERPKMRRDILVKMHENKRDVREVARFFEFLTGILAAQAGRGI